MAKVNISSGPLNQVSIEPPPNRVNSISSPSLPFGIPVLLQSGEPIPSGRLVANILNQAVRYDPTNPAHAYALAGIALNSTDTGDICLIQTEGKVTIPGWSLTPGAKYRAGLGGALTTTNPGGVFSQVIGRAISSFEFLLNPQPIVFRQV